MACCVLLFDPHILQLPWDRGSCLEAPHLLDGTSQGGMATLLPESEAAFPSLVCSREATGQEARLVKVDVD